MKMKISLLFAVVSAAFSFAPADATHVTRTEDYIVGFLGDAVGYCADETQLDMNVAATCFSVQAGVRYRVSISDTVTGPNVGYLWSFNDANGDCVGLPDDPLEDCPNDALTCGTTTVAAPAGAVELSILLDGPAFGPQDCLLDGPGDSTGMATVGTVSVTTLHT